MSTAVAPVTTDQVIDTITAAGLDYHDFKCGTVAKRSTWVPAGTSFNVWAEIAEFPSRYDAETIARAWGLAGIPDPYADDEAG
jgi:hypothetical protein